MTRNVIAVAILAAGALAAPARAQIAPNIDDRGKLVYMNEDSPARRHESMIIHPPGASQALSAAASVSSAPTSGRSAARSRSDDRLDRIVRAAAERHKVDPALVKAVINTESGWNSLAVSSKGAVGLMQLIPGTAERYGVVNRFDAAENVEGGTTYLRSLLDRYKGDLMKSLAAYNAGERAVDQSRGVPAYPETQRYVQKVTDAYFQPGSGRSSTLWSPPRPAVRRELEPRGRVLFTNE
jgi:soluble lytic murein transglycosylase-like protein